MLVYIVHRPTIYSAITVQTCTKVDDKIEQKESVGDAVEGDPVSTEVVVEESDDNRQNDQVGDQ